MTTAQPRGTKLSLSRQEIVIRAYLAISAVPDALASAPADSGHRPIHYRLPYPNGGDHPDAAFGIHGQPCGSAWAYGGRTPVMDCIGHALSCIGVDRLQPGWKGCSGDWWDCRAIVEDALGRQRQWIHKPEGKELPGDLLINNQHVGVVVRAACRWATTEDDGTVHEHHQDILVSDCSPRHGAEASVGLGGRWAPDCIIVQFRGIKDP